MRLSNDCEVDAGKYSDRSMTCGPNVVRSLQEAEVSETALISPNIFTKLRSYYFPALTEQSFNKGFMVLKTV